MADEPVRPRTYKWHNRFIGPVGTLLYALVVTVGGAFCLGITIVMIDECHTFSVSCVTAGTASVLFWFGFWAILGPCLSVFRPTGDGFEIRRFTGWRRFHTGVIRRFHRIDPETFELELVLNQRIRVGRAPIAELDAFENKISEWISSQRGARAG